MPRQTIAQLEADVRQWKELYQGLERANVFMKSEKEILGKRVTEIAAENESLRMDKKWLQQMHSAVLQSMHAFVTGGRS